MTPGTRVTNSEIMQTFGVGQQGGMRRSRANNLLVIVSDHTKGLYQDRWEGEVLHYTGMGTRGDQTLGAQNKTLAKSPDRGITVHLLEVFEPGEYIYAGEVELAAEPYQEQQPDADGQNRLVYMFPVRLRSGTVPTPEIQAIRALDARREKQLANKSLTQLRELARRGNAAPERRASSSTVAVRNAAVAAYAKAAARGTCDLCQHPAPFRTKAGAPYLECHHIHWLARGGPDTIENAVALCPNCHRKVHVRDLESDRRQLRQRVTRRDSC